MQTIATPISIYTEYTPNPQSMKFVANIMLVEEGKILEFSDPAKTKESPLANKLFQFPFVKSVFISANFVTITKIDGLEWEDIAVELKDFIRNYLISRKPVSESANTLEQKVVELNSPVASSPLDQKIIDILDEYIKPAVEQDGGAISFKSFDNGKVNVILQGSCNGCPSSTMTLKAGIEGLLKRFIPEVKEVVAVEG
jgi:NFU1 iron-sulfur cluster scaffold homolog, mitochondrial